VPEKLPDVKVPTGRAPVTKLKETKTQADTIDGIPKKALSFTTRTLRGKER
jgi:hypothetical protein